MTPEGRPDLPQAVLTTPVAFDSVQANYFESVGQRLLYGRLFSDQIDTPDGRPVVIVNEALARTYFGAADAVGRRVTFSGTITPQTIWLTIVGVVADVHRAAAGPHVAPRAEVYRPYAQQPRPTMVLTARGSGDALALAGAVREIVRSMDGDVPLSRVQTLDTLLSDRVAERRFVMSLLTGFAALALLLAAIGIYGVTSYTVSRRLPEFGVCVALGAQRSDVLRMAIRNGIAVMVLGMAAGVGGALFLARYTGPQLYAVEPNDPWVFVAVTGLLAGIAMVAAWLPARRAARVDPMIVLRHE
jgi:putative ABC transport system permease protein